MAQHVRIDLGYDGRSFFGSQRQASGRTVQSELEDVLAQVTRSDTRLAFAGRTDRGVHAVGQVASGSVNWHGDLERLRFALDSLTGNDLAVYRVGAVADGFHARYSAVSREYRYRVFVSNRAPVLLRGMVWPVQTPVDLERINAASRELVGYQDFRSFAGGGAGTSNSEFDTRRCLDLADWRELPNHFEAHGRLFEFRVRANGFLPHMVRNLVGTLVEAGSGRQEGSWIKTLLDTRDRRQAPPPAPPDGLTLWSVEYDEADIDEPKPGRIAGLEQE